MSYRLAESLKTLRDQLNTLYPNRSKASDGWIGDAKHASRASDHNPHIRDKKGVGVVTAFDFTHDAKKGIDCHRLAEQLINSRDERIKYIIWNRRIVSSKVAPWIWRDYAGANAHTKHLHISVDANESLFDDASAWQVSPVPTSEMPSVTPAQTKAETPEVSALYTVKAGDTASQIARRFGITLKSLQALNGLNARYDIRIGQKLRVK